MGYLAVVLVCANLLLLTTADANYVNLLTAIRRNRGGATLSLAICTCCRVCSGTFLRSTIAPYR